MVATANIIITQNALTNGPGVSMIGAGGLLVSLSNLSDVGIVQWVWELLDVPEGSALVPGVIGVAATSSFTPDLPETPGCYKIKLSVQGSDGSTDCDVRNFAVATGQGWILPPLRASADELNFPGNTRGWASLLNPMFLTIAGVDSTTLVVSEPGGMGQFNSIKEANDFITDASAIKPYTISVSAGVYTEDPIVVRSHVSIDGVPSATLVVASDANSPLFTMSDHSVINNITILGPSADSAIYAAGGVTATNVSNVQVASGLVAFHATGVGTILYIEESKALTLNVGTCILSEDSARMGCSSVLSYAVTAFHANGGLVWIQNSAALFCTNGLYANNGGMVQATAITFDTLTYSVRTGAVGTNEIIGTTIASIGTGTHVYQEAAGSIIQLASCTFDSSRFNIQNFAEVFMSFDGVEQGLYLQTLTKDLAVGAAEQGQHSHLGQGAPYTRGMIVITTDDTATGVSDGGNLTDVSIAARDYSGSTFTFQGVGAGHTILIGSSLENGDVEKHLGLRVNQTVGAVEIVEKSFVVEIWDGAAWYEVGTMAFGPPEYYTYANALFLRVQTSEFIHFGIDAATVWAKKTIDGHNLYWSRIRITSTLTTAPVFEQFRLLPNHTTVHNDGTITFHGSSRFEVSLVGLGNIFGENGTVVDGSVTVGSGVAPTGWSHNCKNSEFNTNGDAINWQFPIPPGTDTSLPLNISGILIPTVGSAGTVTMLASLIPIEVAGVHVADPAGSRVPAPRTLANTETAVAKASQWDSTTFLSGSTDKFQRVEFGPFDVTDYYAGDLLCLRLEMEDDKAGSANVNTMTASVTGTRWHLGQKN